MLQIKSSLSGFISTDMVFPFFNSPDMMYLDIGLRNWFRITPESCLAPYFGVKPFKASIFFASLLIANAIPILSSACVRLFNWMSKILTTLSW